MKLALLTQHYPPHFEGGTEAVVRAQARELARLGHEVRVISGTDRPHAGRDVERSEVDGIPVARLASTADEPFHLVLERPRLLALVLEEARGCELVHVHHWSTLDGSIVRACARSTPVVATLHDLFTTCTRFFRRPVAPVTSCPERGDVEPCVRCVAVDAEGIPADELRAGLRARDEAFRAELDAAAQLVVPSRAHAERLSAWFGLPPERCLVLPHGLSRPLAPLEPRPAFDGAGPLRVLHLGHRTEIKGTLDLVRALAGLPQALRARVRLLLIGREVRPGFDERIRRASDGLSLTFVGSYDLDALSELVSRHGGAHLAALPSRAYESYGLVVDEVLALGLPVWVSDRGAPPERVGAAGRVLPADDPDAWRAAFRRVLAHPEELRAEARAVPAEHRTAADAARALDVLYRSLLEAKP